MRRNLLGNISWICKTSGTVIGGSAGILFLVFGALELFSGKYSGLSIKPGAQVSLLATNLFILALATGVFLYLTGVLVDRLDRNPSPKHDAIEEPDQPSLYGEGHTREYRRMQAYLRERPERK